jgi:transposase
MPRGSEKSSGRLTHPQRAERRRKIAMEVKEGSSLAAVALRYQVTLMTVRNACLEHEVRWERRPVARRTGGRPSKRGVEP